MAIDTLRSASHLQRELGDELFEVLISSDNTNTVRKFLETLTKGTIPTEMTVGGRTYEILSFLRGKETSVIGHTMVERAKNMNAHLGRHDREHILAHQDEIPVALHGKVRGKVIFVFTNDLLPENPQYVYCVYWNWSVGSWVEDWHWIGHGWHDDFRVLRRK